jgi:hypothetical protein
MLHHVWISFYTTYAKVGNDQLYEIGRILEHYKMIEITLQPNPFQMND